MSLKENDKFEEAMREAEEEAKVENKDVLEFIFGELK